MSTKAKAIPYVMKKNYISVVVDGKPFALDSTHATFKKLRNALKAKNWERVPKLVTIAQNIANDSKGHIKVEKGKLFYKNREIHNALSERILRMVKEGKPVKHMLRFMDNLYQNPFGDASINEFFSWLQHANMPITDDGHFIAYKSVNHNYTDRHTGKIDNSIGNTVIMPRDEVDASRLRECSNGLHFCSRGYLSGWMNGGDRLLKIKINPVDVVSIPSNESSKGRCMKYEVLGEINSRDAVMVKDITDVAELQVSVYPAAKNRQELLSKILAHDDVKRNIRRKKIAKSTLVKNSFGRLQKLWDKLPKNELPPIAEVRDQRYLLKHIREASKLSVGQVAKQMKLNYKQVARLESSPQSQEKKDEYIRAVEKLLGIYSENRSAISIAASA